MDIVKGIVFSLLIALVATVPLPDPTSVWALLVAAVSLFVSFHAVLNANARHLAVVVASLFTVYGLLLLVRPFTVGIEANLFVSLLFGSVVLVSYSVTNRLLPKVTRS